MLKTKPNVLVETEETIPSEFDFHVHNQHGTLLLFDKTIYFLEKWSDEMLLKASKAVFSAFEQELKKRGVPINDAKKQ